MVREKLTEEEKILRNRARCKRWRTENHDYDMARKHLQNAAMWADASRRERRLEQILTYDYWHREKISERRKKRRHGD